MDETIVKELQAIKASIRGGVYFIALVVALAALYLK